MQDIENMKLALSLARATIGQTSPNPCVGAVLIKNGEIIGMGAHLKAGTEHAEVHAIKSAGEKARNAILYVTLEPCSHYGKTPPCADLIIQSGISKVFIATMDPNPCVAGTGIEKLREAGIQVEVGLCESEAIEINQPFFYFIKTKMPFVTLKAAMSLDGKIAAKTGDSKWITSEQSRQDVQKLRHEHDAILIGVNTLIKDNPFLTARLPRGGKNPIRVVLDTCLKTPVHSNIVQDPAAKTIIFTGKSINQQKADELKKHQVEIISLPSDNVAIDEVLKKLGERNIMSILVEGGADVHASFIEAKVFQQVILYIAPKIIGGRNAIPFVGGEGIHLMENAQNLIFQKIERIGSDMKIVAKPHKGMEGEADDVHRNY